MYSRWIMLSAVLVGLMFAPGVVLARGGANWMLLRGSIPPERGAATPTQATIQQMDKMLTNMAAQLQTGSMTPEQTKQMHDMVEQMSGIVHKLSGYDGQ
jgi:hypothetical protein